MVLYRWFLSYINPSGSIVGTTVASTRLHYSKAAFLWPVGFIRYPERVDVCGCYKDIN